MIKINDTGNYNNYNNNNHDNAIVYFKSELIVAEIGLCTTGANCIF